MSTPRLRYPVVALALALLSSPLAVATVAASDLAGAWKGTMDTQMGPVETTILVEAGPALAGSVKVAEYEGKMEKAKFDGDKISFEVAIERGTISYEGTVAGDEMKLDVTGTTGNQMTLVARQQT